jgi:hypothetical protein
MAYSILGIVNMALGRIGVKRITSWPDATTSQGIAANAVWEFIRDEVLESRDWRFAKTRSVLAQYPPFADVDFGDSRHLYVVGILDQDDVTDLSVKVQTAADDVLAVSVDSDTTILIELADTTSTKNTAALIQAAIRALSTVNGIDVTTWTAEENEEYVADRPTSGIDLDAVDILDGPVSGYQYAYRLPDEFLRIARGRPEDLSVYPSGAYSSSYISGQLEIRGVQFSYIVENYANNLRCLLTDYSNESYPLILTFIKRVINPTTYTGHFVSALAFRLAAELAWLQTESATKYQTMMNLYQEALKRADGLNQSSDEVQDELGSDLWVNAGR